MLPVDNNVKYKDCVWYAAGTSFPESQVRYDTVVALTKFCVPDFRSPNLQDASKLVINEFLNQFNSVFGGDLNIQVAINDVIAVYEPLLITLGSAFLIGFIYMICLRLCGGPIIYLSILCMMGASGVGGWLLWQKSKDMDQTDKYVKYYEYGGYATWGFTGFLLCCVVCNFKNIRIGVNVMKCTSQFIMSTPQTFLIPPLFTIVLIVWLGFWIVVSLYIISIGDL